MDWITNIKDSTLVKNLSIPGTHNSCAYNVDFSYKTENTKFQSFADSYVMRPLLSKWIKCQDLNITQQLGVGVRYFDVRVSKFDNKLYASHTFACIPLVTFLNNINDFLTNNKQEFVIVHFIVDFENKKKLTNSEMTTFIQDSSIGSNIFSTTNENITVGEARGKLLTLNVFNKASNVWFNTSNTDEYLQKLSSNIENIEQNGIHITQNIITPQTNDIIINIVLLVLSVLMFIIAILLRVFLRKRRFSNHILIGMIIVSIALLTTFFLYRNSIKTLSKPTKKHIKKFEKLRLVTFDYIDRDTSTYIYSKNGDHEEDDYEEDDYEEDDYEEDDL
jgi:hypothetical protein